MSDIYETNWHICQGCSYEYEGSEAPDNCPNCGTLDFEVEPRE